MAVTDKLVVNRQPTDLHRKIQKHHWVYRYGQWSLSDSIITFFSLRKTKRHLTYNVTNCQSSNNTHSYIPSTNASDGQATVQGCLQFSHDNDEKGCSLIKNETMLSVSFYRLLVPFSSWGYATLSNVICERRGRNNTE